jgi:hypothetical protein
MSGVHPPHLADLKKRIENKGVPVEVVEDRKVNYAEVSPVEAASTATRLADVMGTPEGVPVKHTQIDAEIRHEEVTPATHLDPGFAWFFMGFAYTLIPGLDRSLFEVWQTAGGKTVPVKVHRATSHIAEIQGAHFEMNSWDWLVHGIPLEHAANFKAFVESYRFKHVPGGTASAEITRPGEQLIRINWLDVKIANPLSRPGAPRYGVDVTFALPINETTSKVLYLTPQLRMALPRPVFALQVVQ